MELSQRPHFRHKVRLLILASRDRKNRNFAGGDLTLTEVSQRFASQGAEITYVCSSVKGAKPEEYVERVRILRLGSLWTTAIRTFFFYLANRHRFDAVIHEVIGGLRIPYFASLYMRKPLVGVWYQRNRLIFRYQYNRFAAYVLGAMEYLLALTLRTNLVLCPSKRTMTQLSALGLRPGRMRVYVPGMDARILGLASRSAPGQRGNLLVWLGKIRRYKRTEDAIFTMDRLVKTVPNSHLLIVGFPEDRKYFDYLRNLRRQLDLDRSIEFEFRVSEQEKGRILLESKAVIVTSPIEGFGNIVSEANACGAPAIVTDGVPEDVVIDGVNGLRVPFGDIGGMAEACRRVLTDYPTFSKLSHGGIELAKGRTWDNTAETFMMTIEEAIVHRNHS